MHNWGCSLSACLSLETSQIQSWMKIPTWTQQPFLYLVLPEYWISTYRDWHVYISSMSRFFHIFSLKITFRICQNLLLWCSIWYVWGIVIISTNAQEKGFIQDFSILGRQKGPSKAMIFKHHIFLSSKIYGGFCKSYCPFAVWSYFFNLIFKNCFKLENKKQFCVL